MDQKMFDGLRSKHPDLPTFQDLDTAFDIHQIDEKDLTLQAVKKKINDRLSHVAGFLGALLQPDTNSYSSLYECRCFDDTDKEKAQELFKRLMILEKQFFEADLVREPKSDVALMTLGLNEWKEIKKEVLPFVRKLKEHWQSSVETQEPINYMG